MHPTIPITADCSACVSKSPDNARTAVTTVWYNGWKTAQFTRTVGMEWLAQYPTEWEEYMREENDDTMCVQLSLNFAAE